MPSLFIRGNFGPKIVFVPAANGAVENEAQSNLLGTDFYR